MARAAADLCISALDREGLDITQLWPLSRHWDWMDRIPGPATRIKAFAEVRMGLTRQEVTDKAFAKRVRQVFHERGVSNLSPERRVEAYRKEELWSKYEAARWPQPHTPYLIQMRPGVFILLSNWQAGLFLLREIAGKGFYRTEEGKEIPATLLYECQIESVPCRIILDCDAYVSQFGGRVTREELEANVRRVPQRLATRLAQMGAIRQEDVVRFYVKNKSRGDKVSFHFVSNILIDPTVDGRNVLARVFIDPFVAERAEEKKTKSLEHALTEEGGMTLMCAPELHVDQATIKGRHQFSCAFSRKTGERPCVFEGQVVLTDGGRAERFERSRWADEPNEPTHEAALSTLYYLGFAHWTPDTVTLDSSFRVFPGASATSSVEAKKGRGGGSCEPPRASASGASRRDKSSLPPWMKSASDRFREEGTVYAENKQMSSLGGRFKTLSRMVPGLSQEDMVHVVGGTFCPVQTLYGNPRIHRHNGVFVAVRKDMGAVYVSCPSCRYASTKRKRGGTTPTTTASEITMVPGSEDSVHPWVQYTEETYTRIMEMALSSSTSSLHPKEDMNKKKRGAQAQQVKAPATAKEGKKPRRRTGE